MIELAESREQILIWRKHMEPLEQYRWARQSAAITLTGIGLDPWLVRDCVRTAIEGPPEDAGEDLLEAAAGAYHMLGLLAQVLGLPADDAAPYLFNLMGDLGLQLQAAEAN